MYDYNLMDLVCSFGVGFILAAVIIIAILEYFEVGIPDKEVSDE